MKATGIVRRIDDLGRVVIPKEIRRTLRIREGDPLEIFTDREGEIILKKYSPIGELGALAKLYAESLSQTMGCTVCITDMDQVVAVSGSGKKELQDAYISKELEQAVLSRMPMMEEEASPGFIEISSGARGYKEEVISPILCTGDVIGAVIFLNKDGKRKFSEIEQKVAQSAAEFLGKQMGE